MLAQSSRRFCLVLLLAAMSVGTLAAQDIARETGGNASDYVNAIDPPDSPSNASCTVLFKVVHAGTMAPVTSGYGTGLDLDQNPNASRYNVKEDAQGASFSGGTIRDVTSQFQNGTLRIPNAPPHFKLDVEFGATNGGTGYTALVYRQCFRPETVLYLVIDTTGDSPHGDWLWAKRAPIIITEFALPPTGNASPVRIAAGPDGAMWFTESNSNKIGRVVLPDSADSQGR